MEVNVHLWWTQQIKPSPLGTSWKSMLCLAHLGEWFFFSKLLDWQGGQNSLVILPENFAIHYTSLPQRWYWTHATFGMGIACRFELYIFYKSIGSCFVPQALKMATVGIMLILNDHVFLSRSPYNTFRGLSNKESLPFSLCPVGNLDSHNFFLCHIYVSSL